MSNRIITRGSSLQSVQRILGRISAFSILFVACSIEAFTVRQASLSVRTMEQLHVHQEANFVETSSSLSLPRKQVRGASRHDEDKVNVTDNLHPLATSPQSVMARAITMRPPFNNRNANANRQSTNKSKNKSFKSNPNDTSSKNTDRDTNSESMPTRGPWLATFATSRQTQERLQQAGRIRGHGLRRATHVLQTLLDHTSIEHANAANLVCALTLSAKLRGTSSGLATNKDATEQLRYYLWRAIDVFRQLNAKDQLSARQLCNAAWALAKHYDRDPQLLPLPNRAAAMSTEFHEGMAEDWSLDENDGAKVADQVVDELALNLARKLRNDPWVAKQGELCMACWAYGVLRERRRPAGWKLLPQVGSAVGVPPRTTKAKQATTSGETVAVRFEQWRGSLGIQQEECLDFDPPGPTDQLLDQIALSLCQPVTPNSTTVNTSLRLQMCKWSELSHVAWAHASHGWSCSGAAEGALLAIASEVAQRLKNPSKCQTPPLSRDMAQLIWSFGILQADNFRLTSGLLQILDGVAAYTKFPNPDVERPFATWSCPDIVQIPLALAHARIDDQEMLRAMFTEASKRIAEASSNQGDGEGRRNLHAWEISILLWAQARLHLTASEGQIFEVFPDDAVDFLLASAKKTGGWNEIGIGAQEQANLIWSMTVLGKFRTGKSAQMLRELFLASQEDCRDTCIIQLEHAHQLWQALFLLEKEAPNAIEGIQPWFRNTLEAKWLQEKARPKVSSARHKALSKVLTDMGVAHFNEHDEDIDVAIVLKRAASWTHETDRMSLDVGMRVAVEFDGPNHFTRILASDGRSAPRPLGHSILKYRILKRQGWTVVRVPYYEFDRIPFWASMERQRYLQRLLKTHSDLKFSSVDVSEYKPPVPNRQSRFQ